MLVRNWMRTPAITIEENASMPAAVNLMKSNGIHMLPVLKDGVLTGIVTDGDIGRKSASDATSLEIHELNYLIERIVIKDIMSKPPITILADITIEETAALLLKHDISSVPVMDDKRQLIGVITKTDIFKVFLSMSGFNRGGIQYGFEVRDRPGAVKNLTNLIRAYGGRISSVLSTDQDTEEGMRNVYIRLYDFDHARTDKLTRALRMRATVTYMVDHTTHFREFHSSSFTNTNTSRRPSMHVIKKILAPVDLSEFSPHLIPYITEIAIKFDAEIHLLFVVRTLEHFAGFHMSSTIITDFQSQVVEGAERRLEEFRETHFKDHPNTNVAVEIGDISETILNYITQNGIDLIIMGTHGRKGLEKVIFGSVAERVTKMVSIPTLLVHPYSKKQNG